MYPQSFTDSKSSGTSVGSRNGDLNPFMSRRKLNPGLLPAVCFPTELFQAAGSSQSTSPTHWHPGERHPSTVPAPLPQTPELVVSCPGLVTAGSFRTESRGGFQHRWPILTPRLLPAGTASLLHLVPSGWHRECWPRELNMNSTILCRAGPASLPEHTGNPYHPGWHSQHQHRKLQEHSVYGGEGRKLIIPSSCTASTEQLSRAWNPSCVLPSQALPLQIPGKPQLQHEVCSWEGEFRQKGTFMSPSSEIPWEADPKLSCCSGFPDPLLDLVFPRHFPLRGYSTALQRWELLKAFGLDAELFNGIFKSYFLSSTCLENSVTWITVLKDYIPILNITSTYIFSHCLSRLKTKLWLPQLYQSPLSHTDPQKCPNEKCHSRAENWLVLTVCKTRTNTVTGVCLHCSVICKTISFNWAFLTVIFSV